jgi:hypothetical protein
MIMRGTWVWTKSAQGKGLDFLRSSAVFENSLIVAHCPAVSADYRSGKNATSFLPGKKLSRDE